MAFIMPVNSLAYLVMTMPANTKPVLKTLLAKLQTDPTNVKLLTDVAAVYEFELDDEENAMAYYKKVLALSPQHALAQSALDALGDATLKTHITHNVIKNTGGESE